MEHRIVIVAVIWLVYCGAVAAVGASGAGRATGVVASGGVFAALAATLLVLS